MLAGSRSRYSSGDGPRLLVCGVDRCPLGVVERGSPTLGIGGVPRSDSRELGRRDVDLDSPFVGTGIELPIVALPSKLGRPEARALCDSTGEL